jgi:hypothetical protein
MERLIRSLGKGSGPEMDLLGLLANMRGGSCVDPEETGEPNCDECPGQGTCPLESLKGALGGGTKGLKSADLMLSEAKVAGAKAQVDHLEHAVSALRDKIDKMASAHTAEMERLTSRHKAETESLSQILSDREKYSREERSRMRQTYSELSEELQAALGKIDAAQAIIASNGQGRPSRGILEKLMEVLGMPPLEKPKKA